MACGSIDRRLIRRPVDPIADLDDQISCLSVMGSSVHCSVLTQFAQFITRLFSGGLAHARAVRRRLPRISASMLEI